MKKKLLIGLILLLPILLFLYGQICVKAVTGTERVVYAKAGDNAADLQRLLDYNKYDTYHLTVNIPAGSYVLNNELRVYSNTTIIADPNAKLYKNHQRGAILANDLSKDKGGYTSSENITVIGGIWDSYKIEHMDKGTESFRFIHANNITVKDATICNVPNSSHLITFGGVKNGVADHCTLYGYTGTTPKEAIQIDIVHNDTILPSMQSKILVYDDLPCDGITIKNCNIYNYPRAIGSHTSVKGVFHKNIIISDNNLHDLAEAAIKSYNYVNLEINGNTIKNSGVGVLVYTYITNQYYLDALNTTKKEPLPENYNIVIKDNNIEDMKVIQSGTSSLWGDGIRTIGNKERPLSGVTIENNTITGTERYGMFLEGTVQSKISNNTVTQTAKNGIYLINGCETADITGNVLSKTGAKDSAEGGIGLSASTHITISDNTISSPGKNGIFLYKQSVLNTITNNTVSSSGDCGIAVYQQSNDSTITGNKITGYKRYGIYAYQVGSGTINENKVYGSLAKKSDDGIHITGDKSSADTFTLKKNYIKTTTRNGIYVNTAPNCYIGGNSIISTLNYGIYIGGASDGSKIYYSSITNAGKLGNQKNGIAICMPNNVLFYKNVLKLQ
ncbi:MAG: right-handed parallel beta-helix repeat-containing protein [Anaerocolumna sp.]